MCNMFRLGPPLGAWGRGTPSNYMQTRGYHGCLSRSAATFRFYVSHMCRIQFDMCLSHSVTPRRLGEGYPGERLANAGVPWVYNRDWWYRVALPVGPPLAIRCATCFA